MSPGKRASGKTRTPLTLRRLVGQTMIVGLGGPELTAMERAWLNLVRPGGVILFRRNIETAAQTFALLAAVNKIIGCDTFRCVDLEGGLVDRLRDCVGPTPSAAAVAASGKPALFRKHGALIAREAKALGFNTTLAPVLDLALPTSRTVMRTRAASADPEKVVAYAGSFLDGLASEGVIGCGKHFPGLGGGTLDSHQTTPHIGRSFNEMWRTDMLPYRKLARKLPIVMISHASYPAAHGDTPASVSPEWITGVLQQKIGFRGLVLSDDLEMGGILSRTSIEDAAIQAIAAGAHLIEVCKEPALIIGAYEALLSAAEKSPSLRRKVEKAARKVASFKRARFAAAGPQRPPTALGIERLRRQIADLLAQTPEPREATEA